MSPEILERLCYAVFALLAFRELLGAWRDGRFYKNTESTLEKAVHALGAQWDRDRDEQRERQRLLWEQLVVKTEQLEDSLALLAEMSKLRGRRAKRSEPALFDHANGRAERMLAGRDRKDVLIQPEKNMEG